MAMPITNVTYRLIKEMKDAHVFPARAHIVEFGESNWYGDVPYQLLEQDIERYVTTQDLKEELKHKVKRCIEQLEAPDPEYAALWDLSHIFYKTFLDYESYTAVDLGGSPSALKLDLNMPIKLGRQYDIAINFGTAEHVFNVYQVFKTIHEVTRPGGIMINSMPFQGWIDHGFFNFQPTFYYDLVAANGYQFPILIYSKAKSSRIVQINSREHVSDLDSQKVFQGNGTLFAVFRKPSQDVPFRVPKQGYYDGTVSNTVAKAWRDSR